MRQRDPCSSAADGAPQSGQRDLHVAARYWASQGSEGMEGDGGGRAGPRRGRGQGMRVAWPGPGSGGGAGLGNEARPEPGGVAGVGRGRGPGRGRGWGAAGRGRGRATYSGCSRRLQARLSRPDCSLRRRGRALRTLDSGSDTRGGAWKAAWGPCAFSRGPPRASFGAAASQPAPSRPHAL